MPTTGNHHEGPATPAFLTVEDLRRILGQEFLRDERERQGLSVTEAELRDARPLSKRTVQSFLEKSHGDPNQRDTQGRRVHPYVADPAPAPALPRRRGGVLFWAPTEQWPTLEAVEQAWRDWYRRRPGRGAGGGRPSRYPEGTRRTRRLTYQCDCGCSQWLAARDTLCDRQVALRVESGPGGTA